MNQKDRYRQLCKEDNTIPIFSKDWWMDAVCGEDNWDALIVEKDGQILASMPIYIKKKYGLKFITQPKLTQINGIHIIYPEDQKYEKKLSYEKEIMTKIIDQLEKMDVVYYQQSFHYSVTNWQPFYWRGFEQTTFYTYVIEDLTNIEEVFSKFNITVKKAIRNAEKQAKVYMTDDICLFYNLNKKVFERQGLNVPYSFDLLKRVDDACKKNSSRVIIAAEDKESNIHAMIYLVWDVNSAYLIMLGADPAYRNSGFNTLLVAEGIKFASKVTKKFDFEGSMIENISRFYKKFGATLKPYYKISKAYKYKLLMNIYRSQRK